MLLADSRIPQDRRVLYALDAVAGLRPWPTLCKEVAKLKIDLLESKVVDGDFGAFASPPRYISSKGDVVGKEW